MCGVRRGGVDVLPGGGDTGVGARLLLAPVVPRGSTESLLVGLGPVRGFDQSYVDCHAVSIDAVPGWMSAFDDLMALLAPRFGRVEPRRQARSYFGAGLAQVA
jgi:hypothetical protein